jgi:RimJ/RimL family protein N-acetyltransferase
MTKKLTTPPLQTETASALSRLSGQVEPVMSAVRHAVRDAVVDALPESVSAPFTGPMIVRVTAEHQHKLTEHLLRLSQADRYLRFGHAIREESLQQYVQSIDLDFDDVFAVLDSDLQVAAMAHVSYSREPEKNVAEFGVSVDAAHRGKHYAHSLLHRSIVHARAREVSRFFIHALAQNGPMIGLARKVGMTIDMEGDEANGYLLLPPADFSTLVDDALSDGRASLELEVRKRARWFKQWGGPKSEA